MRNSSFSGNRLKEERKKLGLTQAQAAEKCGVSGRMWGDYERGISQPKTELFFQFEKAGIDVQYVMHGRRDEAAAMPSENTLTTEEQALLAQFRQLNGEGKTAIFSMLNALLPKKAASSTDKVSNG